MSFSNLQRNWDGLAREDPMWAILTDPKKSGERWDVKEFFDSGRGLVRKWLREIPELRSLEKGNALDFGCGLGRITQALCDHFAQVTGIDISAKMIEGAVQYNQFEQTCKYLVNTSPDLAQLEDNSFDFVCTVITLQHMPPGLMLNYLREFIRIIRPGGLILFNIPERPPPLFQLLSDILPRAMINRLRRLRYRSRHVMEMHWISVKQVKNEIIGHGGVVVNVYPDDRSVGKGWKSYFYLVTKS